MSIQTITVNGTIWEVSCNEDDILLVEQGNPENALIIQEGKWNLKLEATSEGFDTIFLQDHYVTERLCIFAEEHFEEAVKDNWDI